METYEVTSKKKRIDYQGIITVKVKRSFLTASNAQQARRIVKTWDKDTAWYITEVKTLEL